VVKSASNFFLGPAQPSLDKMLDTMLDAARQRQHHGPQLPKELRDQFGGGETPSAPFGHRGARRAC
jgi:hypothetical protein